MLDRSQSDVIDVMLQSLYSDLGFSKGLQKCDRDFQDRYRLALDHYGITMYPLRPQIDRPEYRVTNQAMRTYINARLNISKCHV